MPHFASRFVKSGLTGVVFASFFVALGTATPTFATVASVKAALATIPDTIPDQTSNYLSLMQGGSAPAVNGNSRPYADNDPSAEVYLKVYAVNNLSRTVRLDFVKRDVGPELACDNFTISWQFIALNPDERSASGGGDSGTSKISGSAAADDCTGRFSLITLPANEMSLSSLNNHEGLYTGILKISAISTPASVDPNRSPTFKARFASPGPNAKLGYAGDTVAGINPEVAIYPSNLANGNGVHFYFAPPCNESAGPKPISWRGTDRGVAGANQDINSNFKNNINFTPGSDPTTGRTGQINGLSANVINAITNTSSNAGAVTYGGSGPGGVSFNYALGSVYRLEFNNVTGGNRIIFNMPYDSGDFYLKCGQPGSKWKLDPGTEIAEQTNTYTPQFPSPTSDAQEGNNVNNRAKPAFASARFKHYVDEKDGKRPAQNNTAEHRWKVQFKTIRSGGATSPIYDKTGALGNLSVYTPASGFGVLVSNSRANTNSNEMKFLFRNDADTQYRNPNPGDGNPATLDGDQYCERVNNVSFDADKGEVVNDPSGWKCVELSNTPPPPPCEPWSVGASASVDGDGDPADAWPNQNYNFNYSFRNNGPADNTANIDFYHARDSVPDPDNDPYSQTLGTWDPSSTPKPASFPYTTTPADGGRTIYDQIAYTPTQSAGADNCGVFGDNTIVQTITVPFYYHLKPTSTDLSDKTQQGDEISPELKINLPAQDNQGDLSGDAATDNEFGGRPHTYSALTNWRIIEFRTADINDAKNKIPKNRPGGSGDCGEMNSFGIAGFVCNPIPVAAGTQVFTIGEATFSYTRPGQIDPIGTNICYVGVVAKPTHNASPGARYSNVSCTTIVKSPKIQFLSGDLTVGRHRLTDGGTPCADPVVGASIQATGAPSAAPLPNNIYGSWIEYGAFATGTITGFGTAARADSGTNSHKKLMFSNTPASGNYVYGAECLSNPFDLVKDTAADTTNITGIAPNLKLNEYFASPGSNAPQDDKTGYVSTGADVVINQAGAPSTPLDDSFDSFRGRDILIYAKKGAGACDGPGVGGTITINTDITYNKTGYGDISQLPRIIFLADCSIIVEDGVKRVDAWLIAKDAVKTCSAATGQKFKAPTASEPNQNTCPEQLVINGPVQAKRLLLWRTHGSDLTDLVKAREAAEIFNLRPDHMLSTFSRGQNAGKPNIIYQTELPPLY